MTEQNLKTLKDIPIEAGVYEADKIEHIEPDLKVCFRWKELIKQEAIKWVKEIRKDKKPENLDFREWRSSNYGAENWIRVFFNITEEDLK